ncbi:MAG: hypothetical protein P1U85_19075 [Verrucomicrobiales bacterium]|jgi:hypothetical protein|nr:hypothetical protein [Verrucomicrobiales bacterium]
MPKDQAIAFPRLGWNFSLDPLGIPEDGYHFAKNVKLDKQALSQRDAFREITLTSATAGLVDEFQTLAFQGSNPYSPGRGQSALQFSSKGDYIAIAASGRKFIIEVEGRGENLKGTLQEVTLGFPQAPDLHVAWMTQAENYLINGDDFGDTFIYDGQETSQLSTGYDPSTPASSRVPNRARLPLYTHGRLSMVIGARSILIGDIIHGGGKTDATALLNFIEQVYWATGAEFTMPTESGPILATYNLPTLGQSSSHGEMIIECENRVYALRTGIYPRSSWIDTPNMLVTVSAEGGARGPWALDVYNDNAIRRTLRGLETLTFSQRASDLVYTPQDNISNPIDEYLESDYGPLLRFAQVKIHRKAKRLFSTVRPWISGPDWQHRGLASYDYEGKKWEGVNTLPHDYQVKGLVSLVMSGEERVFTIAGDTTKTIRVLEIERNTRCDITEQGEQPIQSSVHTRAIYGSLKEGVRIEDGCLQFSSVLGDVDWQVFWKSDWSEGRWTLWNEGTVSSSLTGAPAVRDADLGVFNGRTVEGVKKTDGRHFRFLIRWTGKADLRFHQFNASRTQVDSGAPANEIIEDPIHCELADELASW